MTDKPSLLSVQPGGDYVALVDDLTYTYDNAGQRIKTAGSLASTELPAEVASATVDADNRLTNWNKE